MLGPQPPDALSATEREQLDRLRGLHPDAETAYLLAQESRRLVRERDRDALALWLGAALHTDVRELRGFAWHLQHDQDAVLAALTLPWSNGQTEGHVTRLKALKRQMFGRARFDLLRIRFLGTTPTVAGASCAARDPPTRCQSHYP